MGALFYDGFAAERSLAGSAAATEGGVLSGNKKPDIHRRAGLARQAGNFIWQLFAQRSLNVESLAKSQQRSVSNRSCRGLGRIF
ncbi:hypothetical protein [Pseudomonas sp. Ant30-3]|uniref:hypothetical protein n=1 Tax=Pseudomonas sp. Ant30-3 TaxID=1488328 RepID=UPI0004913BB3|nr:hypothetical protein [Pseudomonas sp. Ant30-3]